MYYGISLADIFSKYILILTNRYSGGFGELIAGLDEMKNFICVYVNAVSANLVTERNTQRYDRYIVLFV